MAEHIYSCAFWEQALALASVSAKQCEQCKGFTVRKRLGRKTVRVVLTGKGKPEPHMLRLLCTDCYTDPHEVKLTRSKILAKIAELPFENPEAPKSAHD